MTPTIRPASTSDAKEIAQVHTASWEAHYRDIMPQAEFEKRPLSRREVQWQEWLSLPERITFVACDDEGAILGFAGGNMLQPPMLYDSYLATLYLRPGETRKGLGRSLLIAIARRFVELGARNMVLRTLRENPARRFYEALGARLVPEGVDIHAGVFDDVVYVFDNLKRLVENDSAFTPTHSE